MYDGRRHKRSEDHSGTLLCSKQATQCGCCPPLRSTFYPLLASTSTAQECQMFLCRCGETGTVLHYHLLGAAMTSSWLLIHLWPFTSSPPFRCSLKDPHLKLYFGPQVIHPCVWPVLVTHMRMLHRFREWCLSHAQPVGKMTSVLLNAEPTHCLGWHIYKSVFLGMVSQPVGWPWPLPPSQLSQNAVHLTLQFWCR